MRRYALYRVPILVLIFFIQNWIKIEKHELPPSRNLFDPHDDTVGMSILFLLSFQQAFYLKSPFMSIWWSCILESTLLKLLTYNNVSVNIQSSSPPLQTPSTLTSGEHDAVREAPAALGLFNNAAPHADIK